MKLIDVATLTDTWKLEVPCELAHDLAPSQRVARTCVALSLRTKRKAPGGLGREKGRDDAGGGARGARPERVASPSTAGSGDEIGNGE